MLRVTPNRIFGIGNFGSAVEVLLYRSSTGVFVFQSGQVLNTGSVNLGTFTDPIGVCDADGDGDSDLLVQDPLTKRVKAVYIAGHGMTGIDPEPINQTLTDKSWLGVSDVDGNGSPDLFARDLSGTQPTKLFFTVGGTVSGTKQLTDRSRVPIAFGQG